MAEAEIRERRTADLDQCVKVLAAVHETDGYPMNWPADPRRWLSPPDMLGAWVAVADDAVVGHVMLQPVTSSSIDVPRSGPMAALHRLFVSPAARKRGAGAALLEHAKRWAADQGLGLILEVVDNERSAAIALYERTGWQHSGTGQASWVGPGREPVAVRHYVLPAQEKGETR